MRKNAAPPGKFEAYQLGRTPPDFRLPDDIQMVSCAALLYTASGQYLMQKRSEHEAVRMGGHWGLFGGGVEPGESPEEAMVRELKEELAYTPRDFSWFTELVYCLPQVGRRYHSKHFFAVPIQKRALTTMVLGEGDAMALFTPGKLLKEPRTVPWDAYGVLLHSRREEVFASY